MNQQSDTATESQPVEAAGPWPFITRRVHRLESGLERVWSSRHHRKRLVRPEEAPAIALARRILLGIWMPGRLNWWIGTIFALGSLLFAVGSVLTLWPAAAVAWSMSSSAVNAVFFAGSIPFTTAAYLQLFQAANARPFPPSAAPPQRRVILFGWKPREIGWLSCMLQFVGTVLFNFNTFDAMIPSLAWFQQDLAVWIPNFVGSILFLASGYLAFIEVCHAHWAWRPGDISWWVVLINLLGCLGFMASALFAFFLPGPTNVTMQTIATAFTLQGAICFLLGSLLMLPEATLHEET